MCPLLTRTSVFAGVFRQNTEPADDTSGNLWMDTSTTPANIKTGTGSGYAQPSIQFSNGQVLRLDKAIIALG